MQTRDVVIVSACRTAIGKMGGAGMALRLNLFSLVLAVCCVGMLYALFSSLVYGIFDTEKVAEPVARKAAVFGAVFASLALAFSVPVCMSVIEGS